PGSTLVVNNPSLLVATNTAYLTLNGTSMATGVASGVAALAIQASRTQFPYAPSQIQPNALKAILEFTAVSLTNPETGLAYHPLIQGAGGLNGQGAIHLAKAID